MLDILRINYKKVYDTGLYYKYISEILECKKEELKAISSNIQDSWKGVDSHNFLVSFNNHIEELNYLIEFLDNDSSVLKGCALDHNSTDSKFAENMKRSDIDE